MEESKVSRERAYNFEYRIYGFLYENLKWKNSLGEGSVWFWSSQMILYKSSCAVLHID